MVSMLPLEQMIDDIFDDDLVSNGNQLAHIHFVCFDNNFPREGRFCLPHQASQGNGPPTCHLLDILGLIWHPGASYFLSP